MSRTFTLSAHYPAGVEQVYAVFADRRYWLARLADSRADVATLDSMTVGAAGGVDVTTTQAIRRGRLPALTTRFHPGDLTLVREELWCPIRAGKARAAIAGRVLGAPAKLTGNAVLEPAEGGSALNLTATVQVDIPLVGGKIESFIGTQLVKLIAAEQLFTSTWIVRGGERDDLG